MDRTLTYHIDKSNAGLSIEQYLRKRDYSRPLMIHIKKTPDGILRNGCWCYANSVLQENDLLEVRILEASSSANIPPTYIEETAFRKMVVYEDEDILLVNKPAGLPVHPSMGHHEDTLANYCAHYYQSKQQHFVFRCINRLDRDTSGLVLIAKNMLSSAVLSKQQLQRQIHRTYLAIAAGVLETSGTIALPIARKEDSIIERCVDIEQGEAAITHYIRLETLQDYSLVKINLETGRTHQIRVHMKAIGHPLPGDFLYCPDFTHIKRQALHSFRLDFIHPITKESLSFTQPMPADFYFIPWKFQDYS